MLARAYGLESHLVLRTADFAQAFESAVLAPHGAVIELRTDPEAITPATTLTALRHNAMRE